jgi:tRNA nucleotidyltransferase (CCA-adding enzyme)
LRKLGEFVGEKQLVIESSRQQEGILRENISETTIVKKFGENSETYKKDKSKVIELQRALKALGYDL